MQEHQTDEVRSNLKGMDDLDFEGWNNADWDGVFADHHTEDVMVTGRAKSRRTGSRSTSMP